MDPLKPTDERNNKADFRIKVDCNGKKTVEIRQKRFEKDRHGRDDFLGRSEFKENFDRHDGRVIIHSKDKVDKDKGKDRVYHEVSFRVKAGNNWSDWTKWERSDVATIR
ncbi:hypothetical protein [Arthrobacter sp. ISL-69]|uniref:hypothetical protein n=1 Tax=Arthrobacter sp. ISL-69 TaxID=2819113 RepID=UPI001BEC19E2|nr:hypothetical protein [Arthrobacter sp. ISL-69]MBT2534869.1 hypothetical protein [Arthrobacter sp. ISL-69]